MPTTFRELRRTAADWMRGAGLLPPAVVPAEERAKSLRDSQMSGDLAGESGVRAHVGVVSLAGRSTATHRKQNTLLLRTWAESSVWLRAALDIYRDTVARAQYTLAPVDRNRPTNAAAEREINSLLRRPNKSGTPYRELKEQLVEDYLVLGHGALELAIRRNARPYELHGLDAARLAFVRAWDGTDPALPRYVELDLGGRPRRSLPDAMVMCLVNRPRSYDVLGLSHVEVLHMAVAALLAQDAKLLKQAQRPLTSGALNLGSGATKAQVDQVRNEMNAVDDPFIIIGGTEKMGFVPFSATAEEIRALDKCEWFVRQVAAVFQISTAKLRLAVDTSRANTEAMFDDDLRGPAALLERIAELENAAIVARWGEEAQHNIRLDYPIMSHKDESEQADIGATALGSIAWRSINEVRRATGSDEIDHPLANEVLIDVGGQLMTLAQIQEAMDAKDKKPAAPEGGGADNGGGAEGERASGAEGREEAAEGVQTAEGEAAKALAASRVAAVAPTLARLFSSPRNP